MGEAGLRFWGFPKLTVPLKQVVGDILGYIGFRVQVLGVSQSAGYLFGGLYCKEYRILGCILGSPNYETTKIPKGSRKSGSFQINTLMPLPHVN